MKRDKIILLFLWLVNAAFSFSAMGMESKFSYKARDHKPGPLIERDKKNTKKTRVNKPSRSIETWMIKKMATLKS